MSVERSFPPAGTEHESPGGMSDRDYEAGDQRSSVKISMNAKGEAQVEVKAYTHDLAGLDAAREKAIEIYNATARTVRVSTEKPS